ncbi:MAG: hypothetical protein RL088_1432 [Verrucomicrobiota bacterium]
MECANLLEMKVHVLQIPPDGKHYEGEESNSVLELNDPRVKAVSPITYSLDVGISDGGLWAHGPIGVDLDCECVRCLGRFKLPVRVQDFACQVELQGREMVDLTEYLREDILLALPAHPHCDWDGKTDCKASFSTSPADVEPIDEQRDVWKELDNLKL